MKAALTIGWRDFKSLVTSPMFFLVGGFCAIIWSYNYLRAILMFAERTSLMGRLPNSPQLNLHFAVFINHISYVNIIFIFAIPALTMKLISEERKMRTYDLLLTAPITATDIAVGKFLGGFGAALLLVLVAALYPIGTAMFTSFPWAPLATSFLGLILITAAYVAIGLFASSLTESIFLSVVLGLIFNLMLWFIAQGSGFSDNAVFTAIMQHLSIGQHFFAFLKGTIKVSSVVFFLSCITLFVFLSQRVVESSRWR